jgi:hypothetical protein
MDAHKWSKPYYGISHYGRLRDIRRATVNDLGSVALLKKFRLGCGFTSIDETFATVEEAKAAGEKWVAGGH